MLQNGVASVLARFSRFMPLIGLSYDVSGPRIFQFKVLR
jgi:hypothetical protein